VNRGGHQLIACAGLAQDQHRDVDRGDSFDPLEDQPHRGALTDQAVERGMVARVARRAAVVHGESSTVGPKI
jgi:hypothetical protein